MEFARHDLNRERPPETLLRKLMKKYGVGAVMNRRSPAVKERDIDVDSLTADEAIELIGSDGNFMRRPLLVKGDEAVFGFDEESIEELIG